MAWFDYDDDAKTAELDLHEYAANTALVVAYAKVEEAWSFGYRILKVIHGSPDIRILEEVGDRGAIKFGLLSLLESGEFDPSVEAFEMENGSTSITLNGNPTPQPAIWSDIPEPEFDRSARAWQRSGPNRPSYTQHRAELDAEAIVLAIVRDLSHPAVTKREDRWVVTMVKAISNVDNPSPTNSQRRRLREALIRKIQDYPQFEQSDSGSQLAFRLRSG